MRSHYDDLELPSRHVSLEEMRAAYRALAKSLHPDRLLEVSAAERDLAAARFGRVAEAWWVLSDAERRAGHDRFLSAIEDTLGEACDRLLAEPHFSRNLIDHFRAVWMQRRDAAARDYAAREHRIHQLQALATTPGEVFPVDVLHDGITRATSDLQVAMEAYRNAQQVLETLTAIGLAGPAQAPPRKLNLRGAL